jgi:hypothetical protein
MRMHYSGLAAIVLLLGVCALLSSDVARAGEEATRPASVRVYDVRIVRVLTPTPEGVEQPCPFLKGDATTVTTAWPDALAILKKRGETAILMDQRLTAAEGTISKASDERQVPLVLMQSRTLTGENYAAARARMGLNVDLLPSAAQGLQYKVLIRGVWGLTSKIATGPTETLTVWEGNHATLDGRTLVLTNRQQQRDPGDVSARGVELYCFIHGRAAAR